MAPLETGPFYAIKLVVGDLGTYAGLVTDEKTLASSTRRGARSRASMRSATTLPASWVATTPAPASRSGPALTFGYIAGCQLAGAEATADDPQTSTQAGRRRSRPVRRRRRHRSSWAKSPRSSCHDEHDRAAPCSRTASLLSPARARATAAPSHWAWRRAGARVDRHRRQCRHRRGHRARAIRAAGGEAAASCST